MKWTVEFHPLFNEEYQVFPKSVKKALFAEIAFLEQRGPQLGRPSVDTLKDSKHSNMKELRFDADNGVWRVAFAFDPKRQAVLLVAGDKSGVSSSRFYKGLIKRADSRFDDHLRRLKDT